MSNVRLIVYPTGATWTGVVRRIVEPLGLQLVTADSTADCRKMIEQCSESLLMLEMSPREADEQLRFLAETSRRHPRCRIVLFQRDMNPKSELLAREIGACDVFSKVRDISRLGSLAKAHIADARARHKRFPSSSTHQLSPNPSRT